MGCSSELINLRSQKFNIQDREGKKKKRELQNLDHQPITVFAYRSLVNLIKFMSEIIKYEQIQVRSQLLFCMDMKKGLNSSYIFMHRLREFIMSVCF